ncbi:hypothetical protein BC793_105413 [Actinoplanes xinjiangensis]|uniref:DUF5753 domain-containing protein n=3 Tax=Actinoplanes xinjiangensis TaxID=512350 RepID=A0A316FLS1_9ACTN|nr:hypothetical protein BC793_105413 [Actinoplanes xinjiangensis]GIF38769.1 hypothetical protein Axi01nite_30800 [Actinoplanes xinjiangensis]
MMSAGDSAMVHDTRGPEAFTQLVELEQEAAQIFLNQPLHLPGLLQRRDYAAEIISGITGLAEDDPELTERVNLRMRRAATFAQRLDGPNPPRLVAVIDEAALRRKVGGAEVMRAQIAHLIEVSRRDTVQLAIVPFSAGGHPGQTGSLEVHEAADGRAALFFEGAAGDELIVSDQRRAQAHRDLVEGLAASSVTGSEARQLLEKISDEL